MGNKLFGRYEYLENTYDIETTIVSFSCVDNHFEIVCNPQYGNLKLRRDHPNFVELYKKLKNGVTYNFKCSNWFFTMDEIIDIGECKVYKVNNKIKGVVDIDNECYMLKNYNELITSDIDKRLLISENIGKSINIHNFYEITYTKKFGGKFYIVTELKMI